MPDIIYKYDNRYDTPAKKRRRFEEVKGRRPDMLEIITLDNNQKPFYMSRLAQYGDALQLALYNKSLKAEDEFKGTPRYKKMLELQNEGIKLEGKRVQAEKGKGTYTPAEAARLAEIKEELKPLHAEEERARNMGEVYEAEASNGRGYNDKYAPEWFLELLKPYEGGDVKWTPRKVEAAPPPAEKKAAEVVPERVPRKERRDPEELAAAGFKKAVFKGTKFWYDPASGDSYERDSGEYLGRFVRTGTQRFVPPEESAVVAEAPAAVVERAAPLPAAIAEDLGVSAAHIVGAVREGSHAPPRQVINLAEMPLVAEVLGAEPPAVVVSKKPIASAKNFLGEHVVDELVKAGKSEGEVVSILRGLKGFKENYTYTIEYAGGDLKVRLWEGQKKGGKQPKAFRHPLLKAYTPGEI